MPATASNAATSNTEPAAPKSASPITVPLLLVLALLSAVAPIATDLYLPAFPQMTEELGSSATQVQLTLTGFLIGVMIGQLIFGPLSDRFGRLKPLLIGSVICVAASAVATYAPTVEILIGARFVQGLGGAAGMVIGRTIISDLARGKAAANAFSLMMLVNGIAPVIAPLVGGVLVGPIGWRGIMGVVLGLSVLMVVSTLLVIRESLTPARREEIAAHRAEHGSTLTALRSRGYLGYTFTFALSFSVMMAYISASPFIYQDMIGWSAAGYGAAFGVNAMALMAVSALSTRLTARFAVRRLVGAGLALILAACVVFGLLVLFGAPPIWLAVPLFVAVGSQGLVFGNATGLAMSAVAAAAGAGSALLGALQFGLGALVSPLVSIRGQDTAGPLAVVMLVAAVLAVVAFFFAGGRRPVAEREESVVGA